MKHFSHLNTAVQLLEQYQGEMPFGIFIRSFFSQHKKYGSKDRKRIAHLCYCCFRLGQALKSLPANEKILIGLFLCSSQADELLAHERPEWNEAIGWETDRKISLLNESGIDFSLQDIFPWKELLSEGIDHDAFCRSFLVQPDLFLRVRPGNEVRVNKKLRDAGIDFHRVSDTCLALPNASKVDEVIALDKEAVVQDLNSQNTGNFFDMSHGDNLADNTIQPDNTTQWDKAKQPVKATQRDAVIQPDADNPDITASNPGSRMQRPVRSTETTRVWDCCAASGGKSILAYDLIPHIDLTASDIRQSIIQNLKKRFLKAGINNYRALVIDLAAMGHTAAVHINTRQSADARNIHSSKRGASIPSSPFDLIICDAPCSGSGTWSRTPEQLAFFDASRIDHYANLQQTIAANAIPHLNNGGRLIYITCSVFKKENEEAVAYIAEKFSLQCERTAVLKGYDMKADTLFAASFISRP